jgi:myo-inositol-1(or 4)-monophosphatase
MTDFEALRQTAHDAARRAAEVILASLDKPRHVHVKGPRDLVTDTDRAAQSAALALIRQRHPDHTILAEEDPSIYPAPGETWVIPQGIVWAVDPVDGTTNFTTGLPFFSVSVGAALNGDPVAGAIYDPLRDEMFLGARGLGVTVNEVPVSPPPPVDLIHAIIAVDWGHDPAMRQLVMQNIGVLFNRCHTVRSLGSGALALAYTAVGRLHAYLNRGLGPWDIAAGAAILAEVGADIRSPDGGAWRFGEPAVIAGHPDLVGDVIAALGEADL